jgi:hypothetical protein
MKDLEYEIRLQCQRIDSDAKRRAILFPRIAIPDTPDPDVVIQAFKKILNSIKSAKVVVKKLKITKTLPRGVSDNKNLTVKSPEGQKIAFGDPMVFVEIDGETMKAHHRYFASTLRVKFNNVEHNVWETSIGDDRCLSDLLERYVFYKDGGNRIARRFASLHFGIPCDTGSDFECVFKSDPVMEWLHNNCHELARFDKEIQKAWEDQETKFAEIAHLHLDKLLPKNKKKFQEKLFGHLRRHNRGAFVGLSHEQIMQMFLAGAKNPQIFREFASFCDRNKQDAEFVDESDFLAVLDLFKVSTVMDV